MPPMIERYLEEVQHFNPDGVANFYPGSPWLALRALRDQDRLRLFEMHPSEANILRQNLETQGRAATRQTTIRSEEHTSELQSLMRISYAVFCLKKKKNKQQQQTKNNNRHKNTTNIKQYTIEQSNY